MELVVVGLPGSGKTAIGRRVSARHGAAFIDLDEEIEHAAGVRIPQVFESEGEAGFRRRERAAIEALGAPDTGATLTRVIAPGGGAIVDPRNRWRLFRGRRIAWLDVRTEVLAQRLRRSPNVRPLIQGRDPMGAIRDLSIARHRFYATGARVHGIAEMASVIDAVDRVLVDEATIGTILLRAETRIGRLVLGEGILAAEVATALRDLAARRAILVSEPGAWAAVGERLASDLTASGLPVEHVLLPQGEAAKRLAVIEDAASQLAGLRVERREPIVAVGGGALGDAAGFLAATYLRGIPFIQVPTTLVAQIDSSIGGKTGVDLPEGKNLVGALHQPSSIVIDIAVLGSLEVRQRRAALGEAAKMAALGDERLFATLEADGAAIAAGDASAVDSGALAEVVERAAWAKVEVVLADEHETAGRISLNLGHTLGHAIEAAAGFRDLLHGEAVGYGLRAAARIGEARGVTPPARATRIERLLDALDLGRSPLDLDLHEVLAFMSTDKKHAGRALRWVLPTADGYAIDAEVPEELVADVARGVLAGQAATDTEIGGARDGGPLVNRILVLEGPNLNLLGTREPELYGSETLDQIHAHVGRKALDLGLTVVFHQSNHEGELIDRLHERDFDAAIVNAGGLTHTSVSLRDALLAVARPFIEVHLTDPSKREPFRSVNFLEDIALESIVGHGAEGYLMALESLAKRLGTQA